MPGPSFIERRAERPERISGTTKTPGGGIVIAASLRKIVRKVLLDWRLESAIGGRQRAGWLIRQVSAVLQRPFIRKSRRTPAVHVTAGLRPRCIGPGTPAAPPAPAAPASADGAPVPGGGPQTAASAGFAVVAGRAGGQSPAGGLRR